jgi:hypothetical protein
MILFLLSTLAWGQPPEYTYLERGMEAPFSGRLFNDTASQLLSDQIADATDRCQIEMDYQIGVLLAEKEQEINMWDEILDYLKEKRELEENG